MLVGGGEASPCAPNEQRVGCGFARGELEALRDALPAGSRNPFVDHRARPGTVFAEPLLEVDVQFLERDDHGRLRHASYKGVHFSSGGAVF